jgi:hypothetical protein
MQRLGGYTFTWDPDIMTIPESKKTVGRVKTYSGSAIFQWDAILEGTEVTLKWNLMPSPQYENLRLKYLSTDIIEWVPGVGSGSFYVAVINLEGEFIEVLNADISYRENVVLQLEIRSIASTTTTTTTTTSSTTTTTA